MTDWYKEDLAYIHNLGFSDYALKSAPGILKILQRYNIRAGLIVDLGCGGGLSALELVQANYRVLGIDISKSQIEMARQRVPDAEFRVESLFDADIPPCNGVISIGECLNYLFDGKGDRQNLLQLFRRIYKALTPGGLFVFDIVEPGQVPEGERVKGFIEGDDWIVLVGKQENGDILTRRIITFRKVGEFYRRDEEVHRQQLYRATEIATELGRVGFEVETMRNYGEYNLPVARVAFVAWKPR